MSQNDIFTKNEHSIPRFYLRFFSPNEKQIYQYKIGSREPSKPVSINSICYEEHLYELRNQNGEFICRNAIENTLHNYEGEYATVIKSIISRAKHESNYNIPCFLSTEEKMFLISFVATTILRNPRLLEIAKECAMTFAAKDGKIISDNTARNSALLTCVPFDNIFNVRSDTALDKLSDSLMNMSFLIGVANDDKLFTSDNPVFWHGNSKTFDIDEVIFPLTPRIVLFLYPAEITPTGYRNKAIHLTHENIRSVNERIIVFCREWLYSKIEIKTSSIMKIEKIKESQNAVL